MNKKLQCWAVLTLIQVTLAVPSAVNAGDLRPIGLGLTYQRSDGNRVIAGRGRLLEAKILDLAFEKPVAWVVGTAAGDGSFWVAVLNDGSVHAVSLQSGALRRVLDFQPTRLSGPPVLMGQRLLQAPEGGGSPLSHAVPILPRQRTAYLSLRGQLRMLSHSNGEQWDLPVAALPDARVLTDGTGRALLLSDPTERYAHGALGDNEEAASMSLVDGIGRPRVITRIEFPLSSVFEGLAPIWVDWNGDGTREIVATLSSDRDGAKLVLYDEQGASLAESAAIGTSHRWRHAIAVAPFGPGGEMELAEVLTPHLGGVVQFFRWQGRRLERAARISGFTSHVYRSRNLDLAAAGDFDGDGRLELLLPVQDRTRLAAIRRTPHGAEQIWELPLSATLSSNLAGVTLSGGDMVVAAGLSDGTLRFFGAR